jgi:sugar phosphate isomerase/epimerase
LKRRNFLKTAFILTGGMSIPGLMSCRSQKMDFKISLAEWSLHRSLYSGKIDHLNFAKIAKEDFGIDAIEYVNSFFFEKAGDRSYLKEMRSRADDLGVESLLIMCDNEGSLGDPDDLRRSKAVENHFKWHEAAKYLGCHSIRVNAYLTESLHGLESGDYSKTGSYQNQISLAADGLRKLTEFGDTLGMNTIVENHGGLSSDGEWLAAVMREVDHPRCGTLPDFGNFRIEGDRWYDRYKGVEELMPFAKAVSAKSHDFDSEGNETNTDFHRMMDIVMNAGYRGYVGIEYEGGTLDEMSGIKATKDLLERVRGTG